MSDLQGKAMITVEKTQDCTRVLVTGDKVEMAVFWAIWQTELWPGWMDVLKHPHAVSHREAVRRIRDTGELLLADSSDRYEDATTRAIQRCKLLGIVVE
jgi:hypothetical protein